MLISLLLAAFVLCGTLFVALATDFGRAPASGQKTFDAPGCLPRAYHGPGRRPRYLLNRNCPTPTPVIVSETLGRRGNGWRVRLDGSRSYDPMGGRLVEFAWALGSGPWRRGKTIEAALPAGAHAVTLHVTNDSGLTGTLVERVSVP